MGDPGTDMTGTPVLEFAGVSRTHRGPAGEVKAVREVSFRLAAGEFAAIRGPSGCGKTTLLLLAGGLLSPGAGRVTVDGRDWAGMTAAERAAFRARSVGFVFQQFHLIPYLSVLENVLAPTLAAGIPDALSRAAGLLDRFGLASRRDHRPGELSTGECQRTALARALLAGPRLIFADEPTGNLDAANAAGVLGHLAEFARSGGVVLLVTHDERAAAVATRRMGMRDGVLE